MGGLQKFFFRIVPITMLIMFLGLGIITFFGVPLSWTYLSETTYDGMIIYNFDLKSYLLNINNQVIQQMIENIQQNITTMKTITNNLYNSWFNYSWSNLQTLVEYILETLLNGALVIVNGLFMIVNLIAMPFKFIGAIWLYGQNIAGISNSANWSWRNDLYNFVVEPIIPLFQYIDITIS